jgi:hypothetical protein
MNDIQFSLIIGDMAFASLDGGSKRMPFWMVSMLGKCDAPPGDSANKIKGMPLIRLGHWKCFLLTSGFEISPFEPHWREIPAS